MATQKVVYDISVKDGVSPAVDKIQKKTSGLKATFASLAPALGVGAVVAGITKVINVNKDFEKSVSTLSSLTGKQGEELDFLRQKAKEMGSQTTLSATQAADAMTLIGSRFPDLLKSSEGLAAVTNESAILAEAAGIEMPQAAAALTGALNQFSLGSGDARKVIDTLAAGSQAGAADIGFLNAAIEKAGATASEAGATFQQTVAAIETIAPKITEPTTAGLQLKNVFLELSKGADEFNPAIVGMEAALDNLAAAGFNNVANASEKFGKVNAIGAATLIQQREKFAEYTDTVSKSGVALEQQRINNDNLDGSLKSLASAAEGLAITLGSILEPAVRMIVQGLTSLTMFVAENIDVIGILAAGVAAYAIAANAASIATSVLALKTKIYTGFQWLLNAALNANPIGLIVAGVAALSAALVIAWRKSETFRGVLLGTWEVIKTLASSFGDLMEMFGRFLVGDFSGAKKIFDGLSDNIGKSFEDGFEKGKDAIEKDSVNVPIGAAADQTQQALVKSGAATGAGVTSSTTGTVSGDVSGVKGSKLTNINININKLVEELSINTTNLREGTAEIQDEITKALLTATNNVNIISG